MPAGDLRHRVALQKRAQAADGSVGITTTFDTVATVWGRVAAVRGSTYMDGLQIEDAPTHRIRIRYRTAADFDYVAEGAQQWRVRDARDPDGRREWLDIMAQELTPA